MSVTPRLRITAERDRRGAGELAAALRTDPVDRVRAAASRAVTILTAAGA